MSESVETLDINPRNNSYLLGHAHAQDVFLNAWKNNSLHNSWLISGVKGIGKATFAYKIARFILNADYKLRDNYTNIDVSPDAQIHKLVSNKSHPDMKIIERDYTDTDRKKIIKSMKAGDVMSERDLKGLKKSAFIRVDDVRTINEFLSKRSSGDGWRVVLIDSIDDMNIASANAVLKILEEPPYKTLLLLVSHNPNQLLPTIKSRCAKIMLSPLKNGEVSSLLRRYRTELSEVDIKKITAISSGSIGNALNYCDNNAIKMYDSLCKIINAGQKFDLSALLDFCNDASSAEFSYELAKELILKYLSDNVKISKNVYALADCWDYAIKVFSETLSLNLDKKQSLMNVIVNICKTKDIKC